MDKKLLIHYGMDPKIGKPYRLGEMINMAQACYFLGKEKGFQDDEIYVEWSKVMYNINGEFNVNLMRYNKYNINKPMNGALPFKFLSSNEIIDEYQNFSNLINLKRANSFYDGCLPYSSTEKGSRQSYIPINYLNYYYLKYGKIPEVILPRTPHKFTILFHCRYSYYSTKRNIGFKEITDLVSFIRKKFDKDITINSTGDMYKPEMQTLHSYFDRNYNPFIRSIESFLKVVNDSDIVIGPPSGVGDVANFLGKPLILINSIDLENGDDYGTNTYWKNLDRFGEKHIFGENCFTWKGKENYLNFPAGAELDYEKIYDFINKFYKKREV